MDQLQSQYSKLEYITRRVCKLLGNCKPTDLYKELEKVIQQKDMMTLEANNTKLARRVVNLEVEINKKNNEIRQLYSQSKENLDRIRNFIGNPSNAMNKAQLFDNKVKTKGQLSTQKIVNIVVEFECKMEATLVEMRKLLPGLQPEPIRLPILSLTDTPQKNNVIVELKIPHQHCPGKEPNIEAKKVVTPAIVVPATRKMTEKELETPKTTSSNPSLWRISSRKKKKEPTSEPSMKEEEEESSKDVEELELVNSSEEPELEEEEAKPAFPPPEKTKSRLRLLNIRSPPLSSRPLVLARDSQRDKVPRSILGSEFWD